MPWLRALAEAHASPPRKSDWGSTVIDQHSSLDELTTTDTRSFDEDRSTNTFRAHKRPGWLEAVAAAHAEEENEDEPQVFNVATTSILRPGAPSSQVLRAGSDYEEMRSDTEADLDSPSSLEQADAG